MLLFWLILGVVSVMALQPELPVSRVLHRELVEKPAAFLNDLTWRRALVWCALISFLLIAPLAEPGLVMVLAAMGDTALMFEIWMLVWASGVMSGATGYWRRVGQVADNFLRIAKSIPRHRPRAPRVRSKSQQRHKPPPDDPEPGRAWALAA